MPRLMIPKPPAPLPRTPRPNTATGSTSAPGAGGSDDPPAPKCVGLTGGIGSGKTEALAAFAECGAATLSSDDVVHGLYADPDVIAVIQDRFGPSVCAPDGSVDRAALGARAFAEPDGIPFLERVVFPRIATARARWIR